MISPDGAILARCFQRLACSRLVSSAVAVNAASCHFHRHVLPWFAVDAHYHAPSVTVLSCSACSAARLTLVGLKVAYCTVCASLRADRSSEFPRGAMDTRASCAPAVFADGTLRASSGSSERELPRGAQLCSVTAGYPTWATFGALVVGWPRVGAVRPGGAIDTVVAITTHEGAACTSGATLTRGASV